MISRIFAEFANQNAFPTKLNISKAYLYLPDKRNSASRRSTAEHRAIGITDKPRNASEANCLGLFFDLFRTLAGKHLSIFEKIRYTNATKVFEQTDYNPAIR
jgi:hypothetical protein